MIRLYYNSDAFWLEYLENTVGYLFREPFLHLQPAGEHLSDSSKLGEPDHFAVGNVANVHLFNG